MKEVWRLSGAGNDFLAIADPEHAPSPETIRAWCRRGVSLGADGFFVLASGDPIRMTYWNADGGEAALCLNGVRCAARLAFHLGWAGERVRLATAAGLVEAKPVDETRVSVEVPGGPREVRETTLEIDGEEWHGWRVRVGVPHFVVPWSGPLSACPVSDLGPPLRSHPLLGAEGANVHVVTWSSPSRFEIRSFERGVEAETLACGTGVLAAAGIGFQRGVLRFPVTVGTRGGFVLEVGARSEADRIRAWSLAGDARVLARCEPLPGAEVAPGGRPDRL